MHFSVLPTTGYMFWEWDYNIRVFFYPASINRVFKPIGRSHVVLASIENMGEEIDAWKSGNYRKRGVRQKSTENMICISQMIHTQHTHKKTGDMKGWQDSSNSDEQN